MDSIADIAYELIVKMTDHKVMSLNRLIKLMYLVDWSASLNSQYKVKGLVWRHDYCGPKADSIKLRLVEADNIFAVRPRSAESEILDVQLVADEYKADISIFVSKAISHIELIAKKKDWESLSLLVSSTFPMLASQMGEELDLLMLANIYKKLQSNG